ncbi:hypothetical protein [Candidimonas nitroreducens]|uniref:DUF2441 domain-containing protein n=1 Tax=Candidimonas nitroreducens TaxID=683354 RepID=A0A225MLA2_9BURK|nr:hypothetical protein [Candidimonas nitroreducens]OWT61998.1 hypothetical protein CEY11_09315 [Candidimonas nitroreducens]
MCDSYIPARRRILCTDYTFIYDGGILMDLTGSPLYHATSVSLAPDSIIEPGNFGRILNDYSHPMDAHSYMMLARELLFEQVRLTSYPQLPTRLKSCFAFVGNDAAKRGFPVMGRYMILYRVEMINPTAMRHYGDFTLLEAPQGGQWMGATRDRAERYWAGQQGYITELVTASPLRIAERVHVDDLPSSPLL